MEANFFNIVDLTAPEFLDILSTTENRKISRGTAMSVKCPKCHSDNPDTKQFCGDCGTQLSSSAEASVSFTKTLQTPSEGLSPGSSFALRYKIVEELGRGGMGVVYKAEDTKLKRTVALKFLPPELIGNLEAKERFIREAQAAAVLDHPNICTIYEVDEEEDKTFISMAYVDGQSLRDRVKTGPLAVTEALDVAIQVSEGLAAAHSQGIVHRDIKSANIMTTKDAQAKIMDFGLAKFAGASMITREGVTMGTVAYMSPEQAQGQTVDHRTDIWSLGVVLYEMFSGQLPFTGESEASFLYSIVHEEPKAIKEVNPDIPVEIQKVIDRALRKKPDSRYKSAEEMTSDLRKYQDQIKAEQAGLFNLRTLLRRLRQPRIAIPTAIVLALIAAATVWYFHRQAKISWAQEVAIPEIEKLADVDDFTAAYLLALEAGKYIPKDQALNELLPTITGTIFIETNPPGADVYIKDYATEDEWTHLGQTPLQKAETSRGFKHWKVTKPGYESLEGAIYLSEDYRWELNINLDQIGTIPSGMVHINAVSYSFLDDLTITMNGDFAYNPTIGGLRNLKPIPLGEYLLDKHEVTNKQYKEFVDNGGYRKKKYWKHEFIKDGQILTWEDAMKELVDSTGRPGPSTWTLGDYPEGQDEYPISGISWYEAAAYAEFAGKSLPTVYHWNFATAIVDNLGYPGYLESGYIMPQSNFEGKGPSPVGNFQGLSPHGLADMAGNVKEWCWNAMEDKRFILGGSWDEPEYMFDNADIFSPFSRAHNFGVRCMQYLSDKDVVKETLTPVEVESSPMGIPEPCTDEIFQIYKSLYDYAETELDPVVELREEWSRYSMMEKVSFNAAYGDERMITYLFLPRNGKRPFQTVIYWPGAAAWSLRSIEDYGTKDYFNWLTKHNRAVVWPVYKRTFERPFSAEKWTTALRRDLVLMMIKDLRRTIDYLETREEFDHAKIAMYGISWGAIYCTVVPAIEERIKATIVNGGGFQGLSRRLAERSQFNLTPRIKVPVLMLSGKYDFIFPLETHTKPLFRLFGTPDKDKHLKIYDTGHAIWDTNEWKRDALDFLDQYFGLPIQDD
jgi:tRNA A-37 threonylcarbamoyl transferase component Bud32/dienelactone hydrolase